MRPKGYRDRIGPWLAKKSILEDMGVDPTELVVFDGGAYKGDYTAMCMRMWPDAHYFLFEPVPAAAEGLRERFRTQPHVEVLEMALSDKTETDVPFHVGGQGTEMSSLHQRPAIHRYYRHELEETLKIYTTTIDDVVREYELKNLHLLKMDIQGGEGKALAGATKTLRYKKPAMIYMEVFFISMYKEALMFPELCAWLDVKHYSLFDIYGLGRAKVNRQLKYGDVMFVSRQVRNEVLNQYPEEWLGKSLQKAMGMPK